MSGKNKISRCTRKYFANARVFKVADARVPKVPIFSFFPTKIYILL